MIGNSVGEQLGAKALKVERAAGCKGRGLRGKHAGMLQEVLVICRDWNSTSQTVSQEMCSGKSNNKTNKQKEPSMTKVPI